MKNVKKARSLVVVGAYSFWMLLNTSNCYTGLILKEKYEFVFNDVFNLIKFKIYDD